MFKFYCTFNKNVLFEQKKMKLSNKWHFVQNKTDYVSSLKYPINFLVAKLHKTNFQVCLSLRIDIWKCRSFKG